MFTFSVCPPEFTVKSCILIMWHQLMRYLTALCVFNISWLFIPLTHADSLSFLFSLTSLNPVPPAEVAIRFIIVYGDELHTFVIMPLQSLQLCRAPRSILLRIICFCRPLRGKVDLGRFLLID
jgi:hypothetical protein